MSQAHIKNHRPSSSELHAPLVLAQARKRCKNGLASQAEVDEARLVAKMFWISRGGGTITGEEHPDKVGKDKKDKKEAA